MCCRTSGPDVQASAVATMKIKMMVRAIANASHFFHFASRTSLVIISIKPYPVLIVDPPCPIELNANLSV